MVEVNRAMKKRGNAHRSGHNERAVFAVICILNAEILLPLLFNYCCHYTTSIYLLLQLAVLPTDKYNIQLSISLRSQKLCHTLFLSYTQMATIHPSRMRLVPGAAQQRLPPPSSAELPSREDELKKSLMERRSRDDGTGSRSDMERGNRDDRDRAYERDRKDSGYDRDRRDRRDGNDGRQRDEPPHQERRASPSYQPYHSHDMTGSAPAPSGPPGAGHGYGYGRRDDIPRGPPGSGGAAPVFRGSWQNPPPRFNGPIDFER